MVLSAPKNNAKLLQAARKNEWPRVFLGMSCHLHLMRDGVAEPDPEPSWDELLQAIKADFWVDLVPLAENKATRNRKMPLSKDYVVGRRLFKSLHIQLLKDKGVKLPDLEEEVLQVALESEDWAPITVILLLFCIHGDVKRVMAEVTRRAVQARDWRYVDAVVVDRKKYHENHSQHLLDILGLRDIHQDKERREAVSSLLGDDRWDAVVLEVIVKAIASVSDEDLVTALEFAEEFQCETETNTDFITERMHHCYGEEDILDLAEEHQKSYLLKELFTVNDVLSIYGSDMGARAVEIAYNLKEWPSFVRFFYNFEKNPAAFIMDDADLFSLIMVKGFDLTKHSDLVPDIKDIDKEHRGRTLLHVAVDQWQQDSSDTFVVNAVRLLEQNADVNRKDPKGLTVMQKLADVTKGEPNPIMSNRTTLISMAITSADLYDRTIDWTPVPDNKWNVLHAICDEGYSDLLTSVLKMDNPFHHRQGLTLLDTTILSKKAHMSTKHCMLRTLCRDVPGFVKDHVETVRRRPGVDDSSQYRFPLIHLLQLMTSSTCNAYLKLIQTLHDIKALAEVEFEEATKNVTISYLQELGLGEVITFLQKSAALLHQPEHRNSESSAEEKSAALLHQPKHRNSDSSAEEKSAALLHQPEHRNSESSAEEKSAALLHQPEHRNSESSAEEKAT